ncbi:MAG: hypothetical protein QOF21_1136 [Actinomycetota bacterium]|jgi:anti-sigma regulatory factor (Ser/Thr protein kinase)
MSVSSGRKGQVHDHVVSFYDTERDLAAWVGGYIADGFRAGDRIVIIATDEHRLAFDSWLTSHEVDHKTMRDRGLYLTFDAQDTLDKFMVRGSPDPALFDAVMAPIMREAACDEVDVRAFGEMVALLWDEGNVAGAVELEELWNGLGQRHAFTLYCAYPSAALAGSNDLEAAALVCANHSELIAPRAYDGGDATRAPVSHGDPSELFLPTAAAIGAARRFVAWALSTAEARVIDDAVIVTSELATNALHYADGPFRVVVSREHQSVRVGVEDTNPDAPTQQSRSHRDLAVSGRGMYIVDRIAQSWGIEGSPHGKVVWASFR